MFRWLTILIFAVIAQLLVSPKLDSGAAVQDVTPSAIHASSTLMIRDLKTFRRLGFDVVERRVDLIATVTFIEPIWNYVFVQAGDVAVYVGNANTNGLQLGDQVRIIGTGFYGDVSPTIQAEEITRVRPGTTPNPIPVSISKLELGDHDCAYVSCEGKVTRAVSSMGHTLFFCQEGGTEFHVSIVGSTTLSKLWEAIGSRLKIEGVLAVTLETGTEAQGMEETPRKIKVYRVLSTKSPITLSPGRQDELPTSMPANGRLDERKTFSFDGQVTSNLADNFVLADSQNARLINFEGVHGFGISNVVRVAGTCIKNRDQNFGFHALVVEAMFSSVLPTPIEFQKIEPSQRAWKYVKVKGCPENIRIEGESIFFEITQDAQTAKVELRDSESTRVDLLRNTRLMEVTGTITHCDDNGDCVVAVPNSKHVLLLEPLVPVWKYITWFLLPVTAIFSAGLIWLKFQRNRAAAQAASINAMNTRLVSTYKAISDGLLAVDEDQIVLSVNAEFCKLIDREVTTGEKVSVATFENFLSRIGKRDTVEKYLLNNDSISKDRFEFQIDAPNSQTLDLAVSPIVTNDMEMGTQNLDDSTEIQQQTVGRLLVLRDRTSERQLQAELIHANKIEAVGQLVGGIAHDFNNILTAITANLSLLSGEPKLDKGTIGRIADAEIAANRGTDLVRRLLTYSGKTKLDPLPHSINTTIRELHKFAGATFDARYNFKFDLDEIEPFVQADAGAIEQVLLNLYLNARDAMPDGGVISTRTRLVTNGDHSEVRIWISDSGPGVPVEVRNKIFDPFFTTKAGQAGTGLGLSTSRRLMIEQNGKLSFQSSSRDGDFFIISLPTAHPVQGLPSQVSESCDVDQDQHTLVNEGESKNSSATKTVLVVDDEDAIRKVCTLILNQHGIDVLTAVNGENALATLSTEHKRIDVVLLDLTMPGISGLEVLEIAADKYPQIPVVLCSGYLAGASASIDERHLRLAKPFSSLRLVHTINRALDHGSHRFSGPK